MRFLRSWVMVSRDCWNMFVSLRLFDPVDSTTKRLQMYDNFAAKPHGQPKAGEIPCAVGSSGAGTYHCVAREGGC